MQPWYVPPANLTTNFKVYQHLIFDKLNFGSSRVRPQCGALLKEKETQHTERSGVKRSVVEVRGFSENHHLDINDFLSSHGRFSRGVAIS